MDGEVMKTLRCIVAILIFGAVGCDDHSSHRTGPMNYCINNLRVLDGAEETWAKEKGKTTNDIPVMTDLTNYMVGIPKCPDGGTYTLGPVGQMPKCSIAKHNID